MQNLERLRESPHISVSSLSTWLRCPRKWKLRYLDHAEPSHRSVNLLFGRAWHSVIGHVLMQHQRGLTPKRGELREFLAAEFRLELESDGPPVLFDDEEDEATLLVIGGRMLDAFLDRVPMPERVLHVELPFSLELFDPDTGEALPMPLIGAMDAVVENGGREEVWELKSGKKRWAQDAVLFDFQPTAYRLALRASRPRAASRRSPELKLIVTTKAKAPDVQIERLVRSKGDERDLAETAASIARAVQSGCFHPVRSWACGQCEYGDVCASHDA